MQDSKAILLCQRLFLMMSRIISNFAVFGLTQIVKSPTRINCSSTLIIDHILASLPELISQEGVINVGLSDHQNSFHLRIARFMLIETL